MKPLIDELTMLLKLLFRRATKAMPDFEFHAAKFMLSCLGRRLMWQRGRQDRWYGVHLAPGINTSRQEPQPSSSDWRQSPI